MLETLREFAIEQLELTGELEATLDRHAALLPGRGRAKHGLGPSGDRANEAIAILSPELEEIRAALRRCAQGGDRELGLRLAGATWRVWPAAGRIVEGREWLTPAARPTRA